MLEDIHQQIISCTRCRRLRAYCAQVAREKKAAHRDDVYWGKPVPGFGDPNARLLVLGLAPAAHGANRTGRVFTGDGSGDFLMRAMHSSGFANIATSQHASDGLTLTDAFITAAVRCAPPDNKPTVSERDTCAPWLNRELSLLAPQLRVVVALGAYGWAGALRGLAAAGYAVPRPRPRFAHAAQVVLASDDHEVRLLGCYHPSQHNTFTGRLTPAMLDDVLGAARELAGP